MRALLILACRGLLSTLVALHFGSAIAASPIETVPVDLLPLIQEAASDPSRFAVSVPHKVSAASSGAWSATGATRTWSYAVRIRDAVSLSFHAPRLVLPPSAILTVSSSATTTTYRAKDAGSGDFWSRVQPGDTLEFSLQVSSAERAQVVVEISSLQAGFRGLSPDVPSHAFIRRVHAMDAGDPDTPCVQNYSCNVTSGNTPPAQATVGLMIANTYFCTGTLVNNTAQDNTPYIVTARHCQNGQYGGGAPTVASTVVVYWDARTACGVPLEMALYNPAIVRQSGATTVVEQQDFWLIKLDASPIVDDAQFAGFDASGGAINGGYTVHHALGYNKQFTRWFGQAFAHSVNALLGATFVSDMLDTVYEFGASGPGSSGAALFSQSDRLVGVASLARVSNNQSGYDNCPSPTPTAPDGTHRDVSFNSLAGVWDSTSDQTSSTGSHTLKSVLDPGNTGALSIGSIAANRMSFTSSRYFSIWNEMATLTWNAPNASTCTASGGLSGDGWTGVLPANGSREVTSSVATGVTYGLRCDYVGGGHASGSLEIQWTPPAAHPTLTASSGAWVTRPAKLEWWSTAGPCALSGGSVSLSGLNPSGTTFTTSNIPGDVTYTLTCGVPGFTNSTQQTVSYVTPNLEFVTGGSRRKLGEPLSLGWVSYADSCVPGGGPADFGWSSILAGGQGEYANTTLTPGTFDYVLTCSSGSFSVQKSVRVTIDTAASFLTVVPDKTSVVLSSTPSDVVRFRFSTNLTHCTPGASGMPNMMTSPVVALPIPLRAMTMSDGDWLVEPLASGTLQFTMECSEAGSGAPPVSALVSVTVLPPPPTTVTASVSPTQILSGQQFTITWSSTNATTCSVFGGAGFPGGFWTGEIGVSGSHTVIPTADVTGPYEYRISCSGIDISKPDVSTTVVVNINAASTPPPSGGGSGSGGGSSSAGSSSSGGGGALGIGELILLAALAIGIRARRNPYLN